MLKYDEEYSQSGDKYFLCCLRVFSSCNLVGTKFSSISFGNGNSVVMLAEE